jgi:hypothetical protein
MSGFSFLIGNTSLTNLWKLHSWLQDIPAVYLTAQVALISVVFLYLTIIFCFPAWCWLDMQRQSSGRHDILICRKETPRTDQEDVKSRHWANFFFDKIYEPLVLGSPRTRLVSHTIIWLLAIALVAVGAFGLTERRVGLGLYVRSSGQSSTLWQI